MYVGRGFRIRGFDAICMIYNDYASQGPWTQSIAANWLPTGHHATTTRIRHDPVREVASWVFVMI